MNDDQIAATYRNVVAARRPDGRAGCVEPDALLALVERTGAEAARLETLDHVMSCGACLKEFELLRAVRQGVAPDAQRVPTTWWRPIAAAALLTLAVGGLLWTRGHRGDAAELERGASLPLVAVSPSGDTPPPAGALRFVWRSVSGATTYELRVASVDGTPFYSAQTIDTIAALPDSITALSGREYQWTVTARIIDSTTVRSTPTKFTVR